MHENNLSGISLCTSARNACYIPLLHTNEQLTFPESQSKLKENEFLQKLKTEVFENPNILKIAHSMKEQIKNLAAYDIQVVNYDDVMVMSYVLYCGKFDHDLETLLRTIMMVPDPKVRKRFCMTNH
jgi:DNA polymerase-1